MGEWEGSGNEKEGCGRVVSPSVRASRLVPESIQVAFGQRLDREVEIHLIQLRFAAEHGLKVVSQLAIDLQAIRFDW